MYDLVTELDQTRRRVSTGDLRGTAAHVVEMHRELRAPIAEVWDACTSPDRVRRWFLPVSGDLRPRGHFQLEGNAGGTSSAVSHPAGSTSHGNAATYRPASSHSSSHQPATTPPHSYCATPFPTTSNGRNTVPEPLGSAGTCRSRYWPYSSPAARFRPATSS
jgi:hypothetical protein